MAYVVGANNHEFKLGEVKVSEGRIIDVAVLKASIWSHTPIAYFGNENNRLVELLNKSFHPDKSSKKHHISQEKFMVTL